MDIFESNFILYKTEDGNINVDVVLKDETIWLTQKSMAELFGVNIPAINKHLTNIYNEGELEINSTISKMEIVQKEGNRNVRRNIEYYNLDAIIAVGYRVNSKKATQFRIWATNVLKEYIIKGFALDDDKFLKGGRVNQISHEQALEKASNEYEKFRKKQDEKYISSMDQLYIKYLKESREEYKV